MSMLSLVNKDQFISGGGEMGALIRSKNWNKTNLGDINEWPQSLLITLNILLSSKFPMFLWWGPDLICFYNDAYRPSLGNNGKHPAILGQTAQEAWPEIWDFIKPLIDQVMQGGGSVWHEDRLVPIYRNGKMEDVYWTFSYSPVREIPGTIGGVLVVCTETTEKVLSLRKISERESNFRNLVNEAPVATAIFSGKDFVVELANDDALKLWGKDKTIIGKTLLQAIPELAGQPYMQILEDIFTSGKTYEGKENLAWLEVDGKLKPVYVNFIFKALYDGSGNIYGILTVGYNVTEQVQARNKIAEAEERSRLAVDAGMLGTFDISLPNDEVICSKRFSEIFGFTHTDITHREFLNSIYPEDLPIRNEATNQALKTGFLFYEVRIIWPDKSVHWINAQGKVFYDENKHPLKILGTVKDITEQKDFLHSIRESERRFRNTVMQAPVGIAILKGMDFKVEMANETYLQIIDRPENVFVGKPLFDSLPEVRDVVEPLLTDVLKTGVSYSATEIGVVLNRYGKKETAYFNLVYQPLREVNESISGIIVVANEVSLQVESKYALEESERQFRNMVTQSPIAMCIFRGKEYIIDLANETMLKKIWRREAHEVQGKKLLDVFPEMAEQRFPQLLKDIYKTGETYRENEAVIFVDSYDGKRKYYLDFEYAPLFELDKTISGIIVTATDVSEKVEARRQVRETTERLSLAVESTQLGIWDLNLQTREIVHSPRLAEIFGYNGAKILTHPEMRAHIHSGDIHTVVEKAFEEALQTGIINYTARVVHPDKTIRWIWVNGKVIFGDGHAPLRMLGTMMDVTERQNTDREIANLASIVNYSEDAIISKTLDGVITSWNDAAERIFGYTAGEIIGQSIAKLFPPDRINEEPKIIERIKRGERVEHFETKRITKNNKLIDVSLTISPLRDVNGNFIGASKIARDITSQKQTEQLIIESEKKFRLLSDSMPQFIWTGDESGNLHYFNQSVYDYSGLTQEEIERDGWIQIVHPDDKEENIRQWIHSVTTGEPFLFEHRFRRYDGEYRWQLSRAIPQKDANGKIQMWVGTSTDIDEIKKHEHQKDDFIKMASHELKTPVTTIKGYVQLLLKTHGNGKDALLSGSLFTIDKQVSKLTKLITDLLDLTKIETGSLQLTKEVFPVGQLIKEIIKDMQPVSPTHAIILNQYPELAVYADRNRISQVFLNLFTNAIKYSPKADKIIVEIQQSQDDVIISIRDFGIGIAHEDHQKIFERFYRVSGKEEKTFPGFGIGLFIVNEIIALHKGRIWVESERDKGSVFYFSLPVHH